MMKCTLIFLSLFLIICGWTQQPAGTISRPIGTGTNEFGSGTLFTNHAGTSYSTAELSRNLQTLRGTIEQTLPMLTAYTESVSNSMGTGNRSIGGAVTEILSGVLNRQNNQPNAGTGSIRSGTNVLGILHGLLSTNTSGSAPANATALKDLADMQNELQAVNSKLQRLNVPGTNSPAGLSPTGR
jgi:hypothetical protein